jgi:hypothetical protein
MPSNEIRFVPRSITRAMNDSSHQGR